MHSWDPSLTVYVYHTALDRILEWSLAAMDGGKAYLVVHKRTGGGTGCKKLQGTSMCPNEDEFNVNVKVTRP